MTLYEEQVPYLVRLALTGPPWPPVSAVGALDAGARAAKGWSTPGRAHCRCCAWWGRGCSCWSSQGSGRSRRRRRKTGGFSQSLYRVELEASDRGAVWMDLTGAQVSFPLPPPPPHQGERISCLMGQIHEIFDFRFFSWNSGAPWPLRIFEKIVNNPNVIFRGLGEDNSWIKTWSKNSRYTVPLTLWCRKRMTGNMKL
jgi:hypothetical protein